MGARAAWVAGLALLAGATAHAADDIAWIWPTSGAPPGPLREAAVLVETVVLQGQGVVRRPRMQALVMAPGVAVTPVVHVQAGAGSGAVFTPAQRHAVLVALQRYAPRASSGTVQLDFEAPPRQREAYLALVADARRLLPRTLKLSVTALASWCRQGDWLDRIEADEVVPMLYRLGPESEDWRRLWLHNPERLHARCRGPAVGFAVQEMPASPVFDRYTRRYWFHERNWSTPLPTPPRHAT